LGLGLGLGLGWGVLVCEQEEEELVACRVYACGVEELQAAAVLP